MATGVPLYPSGFDTADTLGSISGIVPGVTHLGDSGAGQGTLLGITANLINTMVAMQNVTGFPGTVLSSTHAFRISALETSITTKVATSDSRLSDARTPTAHESTHLDNGSDPIPVVTSSRTGLTPALSASAPTTKFLRGDATWTVIPQAASGVTGLVPAPPGGTTLFFRSDATFAPVAAAGGLTTLSWTMPSVGSQVTPVTFADTTFLDTALTIFFDTGAAGTRCFMEVVSILSSTTATLINRGYSSNPVGTTVIPASAVFIACPGKATFNTSGLLPPSPNNGTFFLSGLATWLTPPTATATTPGYVSPPNNTTSYYRGDGSFSAFNTIALDVLGATTDITTLNSSTSAHGLLPKLDNTVTHFLNGQGGWTTPSGGNPFITTSSSFTVPAINVTVNVTVAATTDMIVGQTHVITDATLFMIGRVTTIASLVVTYTNQGGGGSVSGSMGAGHVYLVSAMAAITNSTTTFLRGDATFAAPSIKPWKIWNANDAFPASTLYGVWSVVNSIPFLAFNDSATWTSVFLGIVPQGAALGSGVIVRLKWASATANSGAVIWGAAIERCGNLTVVSDHFDTQVKATANTNATVELFTETAITVTTINSMVAGDAFRLQIQRLGNDGSGNDTMAGDAQLFSVSIEGVA